MRSPGGRRDDFPPARKSLGQHFLHDQQVLARIADAVQAGVADTVIEIGPGRGALTEHLRTRAGRLVAVEVDRALAALLRERYAGDQRVSIVEADVLAVPLAELAGGPFLLVGNVPYYITTPIIFHALRPPRPRHAVFLVQREVAERIVADPGSGEYGALSVNVQALANAEFLFRVPPSAFRPAPRVESAVIRITPAAQPLVGAAAEERFRAFVIAAFGARRKQMRRVLRTIAGLAPEGAERVLAACQIDPSARPETLAPADFVRLVDTLSAAD